MSQTYRTESKKVKFMDAQAPQALEVISKQFIHQKVNVQMLMALLSSHTFTVRTGNKQSGYFGPGRAHEMVHKG